MLSNDTLSRVARMGGVYLVVYCFYFYIYFFINIMLLYVFLGSCQDAKPHQPLYFYPRSTPPFFQ